MKYRHMNFVLDWRDNLRAEQEKERERRRMDEIEEEARTYAKLIELDPEGGEAWFDDDNNVPAWGLRVERIKIMKARIQELEGLNAKNTE